MSNFGIPAVVYLGLTGLATSQIDRARREVPKYGVGYRRSPRYTKVLGGGVNVPIFSVAHRSAGHGECGAPGWWWWWW